MPASPSRRLVALSLPPGDAFIEALNEAWRRGDAVLPLDPAAPPATAERLVTAMQLDLPVDDGVALVIATSGSTGEPKGVQLTAAALAASATATHARIGLEPDDHWLSCLPWQHVGGIQVMLRARLLGIPLTVHDRFDLERFGGAKATLTSLVPTQLSRLLDAGVDLSRFRAILLGGAPAPLSLLERARSVGAQVVTTYGMSETSGGCAYDGLPLDGVQIRADDAGRLHIAGPVLMSGYRLRPDLTESALVDGWLATSDFGTVDDAGRVSDVGRLDDVVITGGENVSTAEVASVLANHPDLAAVAVVGVDDPEWGQRVVAVVVPRQHDAVPSLTALRDWCGDRLAAAARPRSLIVAEGLPTLLSGKPDRLAIQRLAAAAPSGGGGA
jgi:o-succinylbenzoate---CoA ligase